VGIAARGVTSSVSCDVQEALEASRIGFNMAFAGVADVKGNSSPAGADKRRSWQWSILAVVFLNIGLGDHHLCGSNIGFGGSTPWLLPLSSGAYA
jgi:hypothetical protein